MGLDTVAWVMAREEEFGIGIPEREAESLFENQVWGGTGHGPVAAGDQPAAGFGGRLTPKTGG